MSERIAITKGTKFGRLTALSEVPNSTKGQGALILCLCECGQRTTVTPSNLRRGHTKSCGCLVRKHGQGNRETQHRTPTYVAWFNMLQRCENPKHPAYRSYGAKGIEVCITWHEFNAFLHDMGPRPDGRSLGRFDHCKSYAPGNVAWQTPAEQRACRKLKPNINARNCAERAAQSTHEGISQAAVDKGSVPEENTCPVGH
jgi:hypothetical protein